MKLKKLDKIYKQLIKESQQKVDLTAFEKEEQIEVNGKLYSVNFVKSPEGNWDYQLNDKDLADCEDPNDPSFDNWSPMIQDLTYEYSSFEEAKAEAIKDLQNQSANCWGIRK